MKRIRQNAFDTVRFDCGLYWIVIDTKEVIFQCILNCSKTKTAPNSTILFTKNSRVFIPGLVTRLNDLRLVFVKSKSRISQTENALSSF